MTADDFTDSTEDSDDSNDSNATVAELVALLATGKKLSIPCVSRSEAQKLRGRIAVYKMRQDKQLASILEVAPEVLRSEISDDAVLTVWYSEKRKQPKSFSFMILDSDNSNTSETDNGKQE